MTSSFESTRTKISLHVVTSSEDVETTKPNPDIIAVALQKAEVDPERAVMIGDAVRDVKAAQAAGVATIASAPAEPGPRS
jgi:HAD superfamily hydrolase (TIGR01509 family)